MFKKNVIRFIIISLILWGNTALWAENILKTPGGQLVLDDIYIKESPYTDGQGAFVTSNKEDNGFEPYSGKHLPQTLDVSRRMYTFRVDFKIHSSLRGTHLSFYAAPADYPYQIYLNGKLIGKRGRHENFYNSTILTSSNIYLPPELLNYGVESNQLAIQIYPNFETTPLFQTFIGATDYVSEWVFLKNLVDINIIQAAWFIALVLFFYFFFMFVTNKFEDTRYLFFSLVCLFFTVSYINMTFQFDSNNEHFLGIISRIGFPLTTMFLTFFYIEFTGLFSKQRLFKPIVAIIVGISIVFIVFQSSKESLKELFSLVMNFVLLPLLVFSLILLFVAFLRERQPKILAGLIGIVGMIGTGLHDMVFINNGEIPFCWLVPYGYIIMVINIFFILAIEQAHIHRESLERARALEIKTNEVENLNVELTNQKNAFYRFVPTQFLRMLGKQSAIDIYSGDNSSRRMSILFSDIRRFTNLAEELTPRDSFIFLNHYLNRMESSIVNTNGFVDKYIGDAIMALFPENEGFSYEQGQTSADRGVIAALDMLKNLRVFNKAYSPEFPIDIGIGINTGQLVLGTVGSDTRLDTTVIGDSVNLASRLEGLTKFYHSDLLISESTYNELSNPEKYLIREIDSVRVKGKKQPVTIYEVFDPGNIERIRQRKRSMKLFEQCLGLYRQRWFEKASQGFETILSHDATDRAAEIYRDRCRFYIENSPPEHWDGVFQHSDGGYKEEITAEDKK